MTRRNRQADKTAAARSAEFERQLAAAQADLDAIRAMRRRPVASASPTPPDVAALAAAEVARQTRVATEAAEDAEAARFVCPNGGGCAYCGVGAVSVAHADGTSSPGWHSDPRGYRCKVCDRELFERIGDTDADRRVRVMLTLLDLTHSQPLAAVGNPQAFERIALWHYEHPGAPPVWQREHRFAHVDRTALRRQWDAVLHPPPPVNPWPRRRGRRCDACHTHTKLVETVSRAGGGPPTDVYWSRDENGVYTWEQEHCAECLRRWFAAAGSPPEALAALG
jgi:hypothetical protein